MGASIALSDSVFGLAEVEMMKEKFAKLLLGEDMSGGGKGVCTALAISNAITNLSGANRYRYKLTAFSWKRTSTFWSRCCRVGFKKLCVSVSNVPIFGYSVSFWRVVEVRTTPHEAADYVEARVGMVAFC